MNFVLGAVLFGLGLAVMLGSVEGLVKSVSARAAALGVSGVALGALSTSLDPESTGAGLAAAFKNLPAIAVGSHVGSVVFIATLALGVLAVVHPFEVEVDHYFIKGVGLVTGLAAAIIASGTLDRVRGALLLVTFAVLVRGAVRRLRPAGVPTAPRQTSEFDESNPREAHHPTSRFVLRVVVALAGLVIGSELLIEGAERLLATLGWSATIFGSVVIAIAISLEEGMLELVPAHRGHPEISVGNVVGTIPFLLGGSLGLIGVVHPMTITASLRSFHALALAVAVALALWALTRERTGRREGALLITAYGLYLSGSILLG